MSTASVIMIDAIHGCVGNIPLATRKVAGYVTGSADIQWTAGDWARFPRAAKVRIDQAPGGAVFAAGHADVLDVENGAATIADAASGVLERQKRGEYSVIYISDSRLSDLQAELKNVKAVMNRTGFWVADWSLTGAEAAAKLGNEIVAIQFASPTSNPGTVVPGGTHTLAQANVDLSVSLLSWLAAPADPPAWQKTALQKVQDSLAALQGAAQILEQHQ